MDTETDNNNNQQIINLFLSFYFMKKFFLFYILLFFAVTGWADEIQPSTSVDNPEHVYVVAHAKGSTGYLWSSTGTPTQTVSEAGRFAFIAKENGGTSEYYIYDVNNKKYISYTKADSYATGMNFSTLAESQENANTWKFNYTSNGDYYNIQPILNNGNASNYINWYGGASGNHTSLGLWSNGTSDNGSLWTIVDISKAYDITTAQKVLSEDGQIGLPKSNNVAVTNLRNAVDAYNTSATIETKLAVIKAWYAYINCTDITTPEDGKVYNLFMVANNDSKTEYGITASSSNSLSLTEETAEATAFYCHKYTNAEGNTRYTFIAPSGKVLSYQGAPGKGITDGATDNYIMADGTRRQHSNEFDILPFYTVDTNTSSIISSNIERLGYVYLSTANRSRTNTSTGVFVFKFTASPVVFDQAGAPFHNANFSSAFSIKEVADYTITDAQKKVVAQIDAINAGYKYNSYLGDGTGKYTFTVNTPSATGKDFVSFQSAINATTTETDAQNYAFNINQPYSGFYYIKNKATKAYVKGEIAKDRQVQTQSNTDATTIFYISNEDDNRYFMAYNNGAYWKGAWQLGVGLLDENAKDEEKNRYKDHWIFESSNTIGQYALKYGLSEGDGHIFYATGGDGVVNGAEAKTDDNASWILESVEELPLAIGSNGWTTFSAPMAVRLPSDVKAYIVDSEKKENGAITLTEIADSDIPANIGIIIKSEGKDEISITPIELSIPEEEEAFYNNNKLKANVDANKITGTSSDGVYALATRTAADGTKTTGFMKLNTTVTLGGHKCYLDLSGSAAAASFLPIFTEDDITGINGAESTTTNSDATIYDLQGRKVTGTQKGRIYIQNGKAFIAK